MARKHIIFGITFLAHLIFVGGFYFILNQKMDTRSAVVSFVTSQFAGNKSQKCLDPSKNIESIYRPDNQKDKIQKVVGYQNNKFGIYVYPDNLEFFDKAKELVNSNGGDWGYVLIPYNVKDYDRSKWQKVFERLNKDHLIPIIQLYDIETTEQSKINEQIKKSSEFLNTLKWPIKNRYISVYNEMNDANFWKGEIDPAQYADILHKTYKTLKSLNGDFFVLNGAFNSSARTGGTYLDTKTYMLQMDKKVPGIFLLLDGWASHSYPQPNFSGPVAKSGRDSIKAYEWELQILKDEFDVDIDSMPIFITETGWAHKESEDSNGNSENYTLTQDQVAQNFIDAYKDIWLADNRIVAVTPFTIWFAPPNDNFAWIKSDMSPYPQFEQIKQLKKTAGKPPVIKYKDCE